MRVPISVKLITITVLILLAVTVPIALVTSSYFEKVARQREESINVDYAAARAMEVEHVLTNMVEKVRASGVLLYRLSTDPALANKEAPEVQSQEAEVLRDKNLLNLEVQAIDGTLVAKKTKDEKVNFGEIRLKQNFPIQNVRNGQIEIQSASFKGGTAMFTLGIPLIKDADGKITHIAVADIDLSAVQAGLAEPGERSYFLTDRRGVLLAHSEESLAFDHKDLSTAEIVGLANDPKSLPRGQRQLPDPFSGRSVYAAYARTSFGVSAISQIPEEIVLEPAKQVRRKVFLIGGIVLSAALFVVFLFSMTLTSPLEKLVRLIEVVRGGNFDVRAAEQVKSVFKDEVGDLASAFDHMTEGLKERDKVKGLFSKFHGSSVMDDLMQNDVTLGGTRRDVVVFFSDIRGFTAMSESAPPEEVVEMLNEYFGMMVGIISAHNGVVDKFIGDAIMAIWGAPKSSGHDAQDAVKACLMMRKGLEEFNQKRIAAGKNTLMIGMGLHAGPAVSGTIGSSERMEYTVIGNTVNTASRIEASTKAFGTDLLVTDDVLQLVGDNFKFEYAGAAEVKGRSEALRMHKVIGYKREDGEYEIVATPYSSYEAEKADKVKLKEEKGEEAA